FTFPSRPKGVRGATFDWCLEQGGPIRQPSPPDEGRPTVFVWLHRLSGNFSVQTPRGDLSHSRVTEYLATPASKHTHAFSCCRSRLRHLAWNLFTTTPTQDGRLPAAPPKKRSGSSPPPCVLQRLRGSKALPYEQEKSMPPSLSRCVSNSYRLNRNGRN
ncbi:unnamed protein product, partial [Ectocarpus sp. 12 AP-2014]